MIRLAIAATVGTLLGPGPHPTTCIAALRGYASLAEIEAPYATIALPALVADSTRDGTESRLRLAARLGATGYVLPHGPDSAATPRPTVAVYVPADSARAQRSCVRVIRSY